MKRSTEFGTDGRTVWLSLGLPEELFGTKQRVNTQQLCCFDEEDTLRQRQTQQGTWIE